MNKEDVYTAYVKINQIESFLELTNGCFESLPAEIQHAVNYYHSVGLSLSYLLRHGLKAAEEIREDWPAVVAKIKTE